MQRRLMDYEVFKELQGKSLNKTQHELNEAKTIVSKHLNCGPLNFHSFNAKSVVYETVNGSYIRANYEFGKDNSIVLENIEEIVINEETIKESRRNDIRDMLESVLEKNSTKADSIFENIMKNIREQHKNESEIKGYKNLVKESCCDKEKPMKMKKKMVKGCNKMLKEKRNKKLKEWQSLSLHVNDYINFLENCDFSSSTAIRRNEKGSIVAMKIPNSHARNEGKVLSMNLKTVKSDVKVLREKASNLPSSKKFCEMVAELKRYNNISDNSSLEEQLEGIVSKFPSVLYLTENELSKVLANSLENVNAKNYDDKICDFMAEGILRTAHNVYSEKVNRIASLAGKELSENCKDPYRDFAKCVNEFYSNLDEQLSVEMQVFEDLYNATVEVRKSAHESRNEALRIEANSYASELEEIMNGEAKPSLEIAEEVATWLQDIVETNLETKGWEVVKTPHETLSGEHPEMSVKAKHGYAPSSDASGDYGDHSPQVDGEKKGYKDAANSARHRAWGNKGGNDSYPTLNNPYVLKSGEYTMKHEKGVDKDDSSLDTWQSADTYPNIMNPYVPKSLKVKVKSEDSVED